MFTARNRLEEARILLEGALELALANDLHAAAFRALNNLAVNHESQDRYRDAADTHRRGLELARRVGDRFWEESFTYGPLSALVLLGEWDEALARATALEAVARSQRSRCCCCPLSWSSARRATSERPAPASTVACR